LIKVNIDDIYWIFRKLEL